jgi:GntR family transcriptional regulator/MocR family aminotransferase
MIDARGDICRLFLSTTLPSDRIRDVARRAADSGVEVQELSRFAVDGVKTPAGLVLGYGAISTDRIEEGIRLLRKQFDARRGSGQ